MIDASQIQRLYLPEINSEYLLQGFKLLVGDHSLFDLIVE